MSNFITVQRYIVINYSKSRKRRPV